MTREWNAAAYDRLRSPMTRWGETVLGWLDLAGDERVLDAGCGTGQVTERLRTRLPRGEVVALDGSASMIERARDRLGDDRVSYVVADLQKPLSIDEPVDAVLSTATFHWVLDHDALFRNLAAVMRPGAQLAAQCGGEGNIVSIEAALRDMGEDFAGRKHYTGPELTRERLETTGFIDIETWLHASRHRSPRATSRPTSRRSASVITSREWATTIARASCTKSPGACPNRSSTTCG